MGLQRMGKNYSRILFDGQHQRIPITRGLAMEKMTMVIVTHEIEFAKNVADRVVFMADGGIIEEGIPTDIIEHPSEERTKAFLKKLADKG